MINRVSSRVVLVSSCLGLTASVVVGVALISVYEDVSYGDAVWIAFSVVSTTGLGEGPQTLPGVFIAMGVFAFAAMCWCGARDGHRTGAGPLPAPRPRAASTGPQPRAATVRD
jgi:hypothetical protein